MMDEWKAYRGLDERFKHGIVKHGEGIYVVGEAHTNNIEGFGLNSSVQYMGATIK